jgi:hypothetical protein
MPPRTQIKKNSGLKAGADTVPPGQRTFSNSGQLEPPTAATADIAMTPVATAKEPTARFEHNLAQQKAKVGPVIIDTTTVLTKATLAKLIFEICGREDHNIQLPTNFIKMMDTLPKGGWKVIFSTQEIQSKVAGLGEQSCTLPSEEKVVLTFHSPTGTRGPRILSKEEYARSAFCSIPDWLLLDRRTAETRVTASHLIAAAKALVAGAFDDNGLDQIEEIGTLAKGKGVFWFLFRTESYCNTVTTRKVTPLPSFPGSSIRCAQREPFVPILPECRNCCQVGHPSSQCKEVARCRLCGNKGHREGDSKCSHSHTEPGTGSNPTFSCWCCKAEKRPTGSKHRWGSPNCPWLQEKRQLHKMMARGKLPESTKLTPGPNRQAAEAPPGVAPPNVGRGWETARIQSLMAQSKRAQPGPTPVSNPTSTPTRPSESDELHITIQELKQQIAQLSSLVQVIMKVLESQGTHFNGGSMAPPRQSSRPQQQPQEGTGEANPSPSATQPTPAQDTQNDEPMEDTQTDTVRKECTEEPITATPSKRLLGKTQREQDEDSGSPQNRKPQKADSPGGEAVLQDKQQIEAGSVLESQAESETRSLTSTSPPL